MRHDRKAARNRQRKHSANINRNRMKKTTIYIDWNLYSIMKAPKLEPHLILKRFIEKHSDKIVLVYSPAHLGDISNIKDSIQRNQDLSYLSKMTQNNYIVNYWGSTDVVLDSRDAQEFFDTNQQDNSDSFIQTAIKIVDNFANKYGDLRDKILREHFKTDPKNVSNFTIEQLDELVRLTKISESLDEFLKFGLHLRTSPTDKLSYNDYYYTAYTNLDLLNYFPDSMNEQSNFHNLKNDALHSAFGSLCGAFITNDNKCYHKSKFLFNYFGCKSKLIKTCKIKDTELLKIELDKTLNYSG